MCEKGSPDALVRVDEPSTCSYILTVLTARLCDNPLFRPPADGKLHPITCSPALPQHHFDIYLETIGKADTTQILFLLLGADL